MDEKFWKEWEESCPLKEESYLDTALKSYSPPAKKSKKKEIPCIVDEAFACYIGSYLGSFCKRKYRWDKKYRKLYIRSALDPYKWILLATLKSPPQIWAGLNEVVDKLKKSFVEQHKEWYGNRS